MDHTEWNAKHPPGTPVRVTRHDGWSFDATTSGEAVRVGEFEMVPLEGRVGLWLLSWCEPVRA